MNQRVANKMKEIKARLGLILLSLILSIFYSFTPLYAVCVGRMVNPVTDICWKCVFPIRIAGVQVARGKPEPSLPRRPLCFCKRPRIPVPVPGIPISFWEPARLVDVTRTPYCLVNMGGISVANTGVRGRGDVEMDENQRGHSFYQVHWYIYPILYWLEILLDFICLEISDFDLAYMSELDPFWSDDEKSAILNPEGILFGNPIAQAACAADCLSASAHLPLDVLFWCGGCQGSIYPFTGTCGAHNGGVQASLLMVTRMMAKLHRELLAWGYMGWDGLCGKYPMPIIKKSQYRTQMTYPIAQSRDCQALGHTELFWQGGREFPYKGSDFGYLIWRQRACCLL